MATICRCVFAVISFIAGNFVFPKPPTSTLKFRLQPFAVVRWRILIESSRDFGLVKIGHTLINKASGGSIDASKQSKTKLLEKEL